MKKTLLLAPFALMASASAAKLPVKADMTGPQFIAQSAVKTRLAKLLGPVRLNLLNKDFQTISTIQNDAKIAAFSGCQTGSCGVNDALVIYDRANDALQVVMHVNSKTFTYTEKKSFSNKAFGTDLKTMLSNN